GRASTRFADRRAAGHPGGPGLPGRSSPPGCSWSPAWCSPGRRPSGATAGELAARAGARNPRPARRWRRAHDPLLVRGGRALAARPSRPRRAGAPPRPRGAAGRGQRARWTHLSPPQLRRAPPGDRHRLREAGAAPGLPPCSRRPRTHRVGESARPSGGPGPGDPGDAGGLPPALRALPNAGASPLPPPCARTGLGGSAGRRPRMAPCRACDVRRLRPAGAAGRRARAAAAGLGSGHGESPPSPPAGRGGRDSTLRGGPGWSRRPAVPSQPGLPGAAPRREPPLPPGPLAGRPDGAPGCAAGAQLGRGPSLVVRGAPPAGAKGGRMTAAVLLVLMAGAAARPALSLDEYRERLRRLEARLDSGDARGASELARALRAEEGRRARGGLPPDPPGPEGVRPGRG